MKRVSRVCSTLVHAVVVAAVVGVLCGATAFALPASGWLFDEGSGSTAYPAFGSVEGTLHGAAGWSSDAPFPYAGNHSVSFTATNGDKVVLEGGHSFGETGAIQFWACRDFSGGDWRYVFDSPGGQRYAFYHVPDWYTAGTAWGLELGSTTVSREIPIDLIPQGQWTHVAVVWDNAEPTAKERIYKNGSLAYTYDVTVGAKSPSAIKLGSHYPIDQQAWNGKIDEFVVWDTPLNAETVAWLSHNSVSDMIPARPSPPSDAWVFDEGSGTAANPRFGTTVGTLEETAGWSSEVPLPYSGNHSVAFHGDVGGHKGDKVTFAGGHAFGTAGTIQLWLYPEFDVNGAANWVYAFDSPSGDRYTLTTDRNGKGWYVILDDQLFGPMPADLIPQGEWTHLAIVWDNADPTQKERIYKNGALAYTDNVAITAGSPSTIYFGNSKNGWEAWLGELDEFAIWDQALTPGQVHWLYTNSVNDIPEPVTLSLLGVGLLALIRRRPRFRS